MSTLNTADIKVIEFQDDADSDPVRTNFSAIKNAVNDNQSQISAIVSPTAGNAISNPDFDSDIDWTKGTGWTIASGKADCDGTQIAASDLSQANRLTVGQTYSVQFTVSDFTAGTVTPFCGTQTGSARSANGTYTENITCAGNASFILQGNATFDGKIDSVIVNGAEIENARDNFNSLRANLRARRVNGDRVEEDIDLKVTAQTVNDDTVKVAAGSGVVAGVGIIKTAVSNSGSFTAAAAGNHKLVVIVINSDNTIQGLEGTEQLQANPVVYPSIDETQLPLAHFTLDDTAPVVITNSDIVDDRYIPINPFMDYDFMDAEYTYTVGGLVDTMVITDNRGIDHTFQVNYNGSDQVSTIVVTIDSTTYTQTFTYDGSGYVTNEDITLS